jgi:soluble lytic murein transglycosylase-like protein
MTRSNESAAPDPDSPEPGDGQPHREDGLPRPLPAELSNWQVIDDELFAAGPAAIDGEATPIAEPLDEDEPVAEAAPAIDDHPDEYLVAAIPERIIPVEAGATAIITVQLVNNGPRRATLRLGLEGWLEESWSPERWPEVTLEPGQRGEADILLTPPRSHESSAGDHALAVIVRADAYPGRRALVGVTLRIHPYVELALDLLHHPSLTLSRKRQAVTVPLLLRNQSNRPLAVWLAAGDRQGEACYEFLTPGATQIPGRASLHLRAGQSVRAPLRIRANGLPWFGLQPRVLPVIVVAEAEGVRSSRRRLSVGVLRRPVFGALHVASAGGLALAATLGLVIMALTGIVAVQMMRLPTQAVTVPPVAAAAPQIIVVALNQPASAPFLPASARAGNTQPAPAGPNAVAPDPALPLVLPNQISTPADGVRATGGLAPAVASGEVAAAPQALAPVQPAQRTGEMSYAELFQSTARLYDMDWRMLAAMAYVESGFDSLALSDAGAMGLMQILPGTWQEFAPAVGGIDPFDSYDSVRVATVYLDYVRTLFAQKGYTGKEWMLVAYHWGPDKLGDFLAGGGTWETLPVARQQYVTDILRIAQSLP